jgi:DDE superfamily endonuclease
MDYVIPSLVALLAPFRSAFRQEAFATFQHVLVAWLLCPGTRTLTEVWQVSALAGKRHFDAIYHLFGSASWDWDEIGILLCLLLLTHLVPTGFVWIAIDDTLCHKRGAKVGLGGIFLDPVLSSKRRKVFRFGVNWVVLGLVVRLPFRPDRYHCLPVLWRAFRKKGLPGHKKRTQLAAELAGLVAGLLPGREVWLVADSAYINAVVLRDRPANLQVIGPLPLNAALFELPPPRQPGQRGRTPQKGPRLPTPRALLDNPAVWPAVEDDFVFVGGTRRLRVQVLRDVLWYSACRSAPVQVVLVHDPAGAWPDTALLCTDPRHEVAAVVQGYARRWSIEVLFHDSKQYLGLQEPQVWTERSVERAHPMAWFGYSLTLLWYALQGTGSEAPRRDRPWYRGAVRPAFPEILGTLRLALWRGRYFEGCGNSNGQLPTAELLQNLLHGLATVR